MGALGIENLTPMMKQYLEVKDSHPDSILFFRLGDFYEMFFDDAKVASQILNIALTTRNKNSENSVPLCGIPYHSANSYIAKLIGAGHRVAICEQMEDPKNVKGIVKREVVRVVTPGLYDDLENLEATTPNFLSAITQFGKNYQLAAVDILTGEVIFGIFEKTSKLLSEVLKLSPREFILCLGNKAFIKELLLHFPHCRFNQKELLDPISPLDRTLFHEEFVQSYENLDSFCELKEEKKALDLLLDYVTTSQKGVYSHLSRITFLRQTRYLNIDSRTANHLELVARLNDHKGHGTLFWALNKTCTPMGARLLKKWILFPLLDLERIKKRQEAIVQWLGQFEDMDFLLEPLRGMGDLERLSGRLALGHAHPRDLAQIRNCLIHLEKIKTSLVGRFSDLLMVEILNNIPSFTELQKKLLISLVEDPPFSFKEGGVFKQGYHDELDELRKIDSQGKQYIASLEASERKATGIANLKVKYNRVFGYYIEVTNSHLGRVPTHYIRKQTLSNAERFITPKLKEYEDKVLGAQERIRLLEQSLFEALLKHVQGYLLPLKKAASALARLDVLAALAKNAKLHHYVRPALSEDKNIIFERGRHPVLERILPQEKFIPNDLNFEGDGTKLFLITGPNMAGKSTLMRQVALTVIMAQMGSFVPASSATIGIVDGIMSRLGATDDLSAGMSTFMVEMVETSYILRQATSRSLILLDEIGRGTSTYDGLSIAWAVAKHLVEKIQCRTLFATHYHELTAMEDSLAGVRNFHISIKEWNGEILFLRKLALGAASRSYGIEVAKLAGLPEEILSQAKKKLLSLEKIQDIPKETDVFSGQFHLFKEHAELGSEIISFLKEIDLNEKTPLEAMQILAKLKDKIVG